MRIAALAIASLVCVVAACSPPAQQQTDGGSNLSVENGGTGASSMEPGQYRTTVTILEMNIPGVPAQNINMQPTTSEDCVTATDIAEFTRHSMVEADNGETCTQNNMTAAGGHIDGQATCSGDGGSRTMHMTGTYTSNHIEMEIASSAAMPNGGGNMTQRMRMVSERVGACTGGTN